MKVAVYWSHERGGARRLAEDQVRGLRQLGHDVRVFRAHRDTAFPGAGDDVVELYRQSPPTQRRRPLITPYFHAWELRSTWNSLAVAERVLADRIAAWCPDVTLVHDCPFVFGPRMLENLSPPVCVYLHSAPFLRRFKEDRSGPGDRLRWLWYSPARWLSSAGLWSGATRRLRRATRVLSNSRFTSSQVVRRLGVSSTVVYPGVDTSVFYPGGQVETTSGTDLDLGGRDVLSIGGLRDPQKGHEVVVQGLGQIPGDRRPRLRILSPNAEDVEGVGGLELSRECGVEVSVSHCSSAVGMRDEYSRSSMLVCAYRLEPFGMVALEAMACGTPVIAANEGGLPEIVPTDRCGILIDRAPAAVSTAVSRVIDDGPLRNGLVERALSEVRGRWNLGTAIDRLERELIGSVLSAA